MPRCFKNGNAANCSAIESWAASRRYGIVRREKYNALPWELTTTFTTFGFSYSAGSVIGVAAVDMGALESTWATASITPGSISGSSPRSEEHPTGLQQRFGISYALFRFR